MLIMPPEQIKLITKLYLEGKTLNEIGKIIGKDRSTIGYHIKKLGLNSPQNLKMRAIIFEERKKAKRIEKEMKERVKKNLCVRCGQPKTDIKWSKTKYCSLKCWVNEN